MTREEFVDRWIAELVGNLLNGFSVERASAGLDGGRLISDEVNARVGRHFIAQQRAVKALLGRMWDSLQSPEK